MAKMHKQRQSEKKLLLWTALVVLLVRCILFSEMGTEFRGIDSTGFTSISVNVILRYGWTLLKAKTILKARGLGDLLHELSVTKLMS